MDYRFSPNMVYKVENLFENSHAVDDGYWHSVYLASKKLKSAHWGNFKDFLLTHRQVCIPLSYKYQVGFKEA